MSILLTRKLPIKSWKAFIEESRKIQDFATPDGTPYKVSAVDDNHIMTFQRMNGKTRRMEKLNLEKVYDAYEALSEFRTIDFKPFTSGKQSPARALLFHLGMLH